MLTRISICLQVCHIVLGLRPQSKDEERDIIMWAAILLIGDERIRWNFDN